MFGSQTLDVLIGILFIFIFVSIICAAIREGLESFLKTRAAYLEYGIRELLNDKSGEGLARLFYNHPLIYSLYAGDYRPRTPLSLGDHPILGNLPIRGVGLPSYIPSKNFAMALMDLVARGPITNADSISTHASTMPFDSLRANLAKLENPQIQRVLLTAIDSAQDDFNKAVRNLEMWYDSAMDRISGWYKRLTQWIIFLVALIVAIVLNIDTITIANYLYTNDTARAVIVAQAEQAASNSEFVKQPYSAVKVQLQELSLPIGWNKDRNAAQSGKEAGTNGFGSWRYWGSPVLGWLLTAFAATMGAPFWFDVMNKVMVIRSTAKPHEKSPDEASDDR